jgi:hypothetical protein
MKNFKAYILSLLCSGMIATSCNYLDVVPDNIPTINNAFTTRSRAEQFLFTCYCYMPDAGSLFSSAMLAGDEFWVPYPQFELIFRSFVFENLARGNQNIVSPHLNWWDGSGDALPLFVALRDCNIFFENIDLVPGLSDLERRQWVAEVKFLKAYYHYYLLRMYGPIPIIRENLPASASLEAVQVKREHVDLCFDYIVDLLDEAVPDLPLKVQDEISDLGRATQPMALALKAKVLVEAASPLFNGNPDYVPFKNIDGTELFDPEYKREKWVRAAEACANAIDTCILAGNALYKFQPGIGDNLSPEIVTQLSIRNACTERWNDEIVWGDPNSTTYTLQSMSMAFIDPAKFNNYGVHSLLAPPLKIAEMFYTENGVPIEEDQQWAESGQYDDRYGLKMATAADKLHIQEGSMTAALNFNREIRFYANLGFDNGLWYGIGRYDENDQWVLDAKLSEFGGKKMQTNHSVTGYFCKKWPYWRSTLLPGDGGGYSTEDAPFPTIRLADLYLLYAEALNESMEGNTSSGEALEWIDLVRERAGLDGVVESWADHARPALKNKPSTKEGLRSIIRRERLIELASEGQRYWDIRRWKLSRETYNNQPIQGWNVDGEDDQGYYQVRTIFTQKFSTRDYLWPISEYSFSVNPNLVQNPGW